VKSEHHTKVGAVGVPFGRIHRSLRRRFQSARSIRGVDPVDANCCGENEDPTGVNCCVNRQSSCRVERESGPRGHTMVEPIHLPHL
jgi:hypothetical protein